MTDEEHEAESAVQAAAPAAAAVPADSPPPGPAASALSWSPPAVPAPDYSQAGVPSLDFVRDKIEGRYAQSLGSTELAQETPEARSFAEQQAEREEAAQQKLAAIRRSLRGDSTS